MLNNWADSRECQSMLPELIKRLIYASTRNLKRLTIPSGDDVNLPGWDCVVESKERIFTIDEGVSLWELGSNKNVSSKIRDDFNKRDDDTQGFLKQSSTFVFVTPRYWKDSTEWVERTRKTSQWKDIIVLTAIELEDWICSHPTVGIWLAGILGFVKDKGIILPEDYWDLWSKGRTIHLRPDLLLGGRCEAIQKLKDFIQNEPSIVHIEAISQEEALAFVIAFCLSYDIEIPSLLSRAIIVNDREQLIRMSNNYENLIFITKIPNIPFEVANRGHYVISTISPADEVKDAISLPIIFFDTFVKSLVLSGVDESKARVLAHDTSRDIMSLRRRLNIDTLQPQWTRSQDILFLLPTLMVGRWNSDCEGDKKLIECLAGTTYDLIEQKLIIALNSNDSPFVKVDVIWRSRSPYESIRYVLNLFTESYWKRFCDVAIEAFSDDDPDVVDKINTSEIRLWKHKQKMSIEIKKGICQTLILLTIHDSNKWQPQVDSLISELLNGFTLKRYLSCRHLFPMIAEASPDCVLSFIEAEVSKNDNIVAQLFISGRERTFGFLPYDIYYTELLLALEAIAWDEQFLLRSSLLLLQLCKYPQNDGFLNSPMNSLRRIFRFIIPQTYVEVDNQNEVLKALMNICPNSTCDLIMKLLNDFSQRSFPFSSHYKWRLFSHRRSPKYINPISSERIIFICDMLLNNIDLDTHKVCQLIDIAFMPELKQCIGLTIVNYLSDHQKYLKGNELVCDKLREQIILHISHSDAAWTMKKVELKPYQMLLSNLLSDDVIEQHKWLFKDRYVEIPSKWINSGKERYEALRDMRIQAINDIIQDGGYESIVQMSCRVDYPSILGESYYFSDKATNLENIISDYIDHRLSFEFLSGYGYIYFLEHGTGEMIRVAKTIQPEDVSIDWLCAPKYQTDIAAYIEENMSVSAQNRYWGKVNIWGLPTNANNENLITKLIEVNRNKEALSLLSKLIKVGENLISDQMMLDILLKILSSDINGLENFSPDCFIDIIEEIQKTDNADIINQLLSLELNLYPLFVNRMDTSNLIIVQEALLKPEVMIELISLAYLHCDDNDNINKSSYQKDETSLMLSKHAFSLLYDLHKAPYVDIDQANVEDFKSYIKHLQELAIERNLVKMTNHTIGHLLAYIPENDNYPPEYLSDMIEQLSDKTVDESYRIQMFNKRGVTTRSINAGGDIERRLIERYQRYANKTRFSYPRITKIFNELIIEYQRIAQKEDNEAKLIDLE